MPNKQGLMYRKNKVLTNFVPQIRFKKLKTLVEDISDTEEEFRQMFANEDLVIVDTEELVEIIEKVEDPTNPLYYTYVDELQLIRRNAKRKLECWIRRNKTNIREMGEADKNKLMDYIEMRYFNKK